MIDYLCHSDSDIGHQVERNFDIREDSDGSFFYYPCLSFLVFVGYRIMDVFDQGMVYVIWHRK